MKIVAKASSRHLAKDDVVRPLVAIMDFVRAETLQNPTETKDVLHFADDQVKPLILNVTNNAHHHCRLRRRIRQLVRQARGNLRQSQYHERSTTGRRRHPCSHSNLRRLGRSGERPPRRCATSALRGKSCLHRFRSWKKITRGS